MLPSLDEAKPTSKPEVGKVSRRNTAADTDAIDEVGGFCCPAPPGPRLPKLVKQRGRPCYRSHLEIDPITAVSCRAKTLPLPRASILVRPHETPPRRDGGDWWRRRALPPGPLRLFRTPFIAIVRCRTPHHMGRRRGFATAASFLMSSRRRAYSGQALFLIVNRSRSGACSAPDPNRRNRRRIIPLLALRRDGRRPSRFPLPHAGEGDLRLAIALPRLFRA